MDGTWKTGSYYGTFKDGFTTSRRTAPASRPRRRPLIAAKRRPRSRSGTFNEFQGPLYDQTGKLRVQGQEAEPRRHPRDELARQGRHRQPEGLIVLAGERLPAASPLAVPAVDAARHHEALPRRRRERRRRLRDPRRRGARAARRERRRQDHALEHPHGPLPPRRGRARAARRARRRSRSPRDALDARHLHGAPALPARRAVHGRRERHRSATTAASGRARRSTAPRSSAGRRARRALSASPSTRARGSGSSRSASSSGSRS